MTILTSQTVVGIDIAKAEVVVYRADLETIESVKNDRASLKRWLKTLPARSAIAVWTCPYKTGHQLPVKLMQLPSA